ncbi:hypothetical protein [Planktothrix sp. FACHB-1365]|uniref:hypothetical protein n=1 Tax=Planktothrix sp. FACHB-1365 TaxID=2692855 RepID=UPI0016859BBC|nr:hypothetical protein [Planktothrix sp. FACHB-1365]MBD2480408.1 hypothetical protein [Planktothrix sp. FACHB-1365]
MSKSNKPKNRKKYSLNNPDNQDYLSLRDELHKALKQEEFIVEIPVTDDEHIEIKENNDNSKLKKVFINELHDHDDKESKVTRIWKIDLEKDFTGISTSSKTPECAILVLQKYESSYKLNILLIELKSFVDKNKSEEIEEKFCCAMTRLYMLLVLNNHLNPIQNYNKATIYIDFQGILFYKDKDNKFNSSADNNKDKKTLYSILQNSDKSEILTYKTILRKEDKIKVKCFKASDKEVFNISLQTLLSK